MENSQRKTPVTFVGDVIAEVFDHDQGTNGTFQLLLEDPTDSFEVRYSQYLCCILILQVTPNIGINEASFMIRVKDAAKLDFEKVRLFNLSLVAREVVENGRESRVAVTIHVRDQNDNRPMFSLSKYEVWIKENLSPGHGIINIAAKDLDSGVFGTPGIM